MISCRDVNNLQMDGMELVAGAAGLDRIVSWTYLVQTKPYKEHMNPGNFALLVVDYKRFSMDEAYDAMVELNELVYQALRFRLWRTGKRHHRG